MDTTTATAPTGADIDEVGALLATLLDSPADAPTACPGWTAHELAAHLAAGAAEESSLIDAHLRGQPPRATRRMDAREAPCRALPHDELLGLLVEDGARLTDLIANLAARGDNETVEFTGLPMRAADFAMHSRSECALHRWDLVGSDAVSLELLARPALTEHAVRILSTMATLPEAFASRAPQVDPAGSVQTILRSPGADDVVVRIDHRGASARLQASEGQPATTVLHPADRLLLLWGRRPLDTDGALFGDDSVLRALAWG